MITRDRKYLEADGSPGLMLLRGVCREHANELPRLERLRDIYQLNHAIDNRVRKSGQPNNKLTHDLPGYIVAIAAGYLVGQPVAYAGEDQEAALFALKDAYDRANVPSIDAELAQDASTYGKAVELCYANAQSAPRCAQASPLSCYVVYDDTVEHLPLFGVQEGDVRNAQGERTGSRVVVYTPDQVLTYEGADTQSVQLADRAPHYFGGVPMVEYWNNAQEMGDFERVLSLIEAYDLLESDRVNDKSQFVDALLVLLGVSGFGQSDNPEDTRTPAQRLREDKVICLPADGADAKWLCQQLNEADVEVLRKALVSDIHKLSMVPDLTDENFAANASGVAMRYKLFGLEQLTKGKERWFEEGLRSRLRLFSHFLSVKGMPLLDAERVQITFTRALPVNELEMAQMVQTLQGIVPDELLLAQVPFVSDTEAALAMLSKQKQEQLKQQQAVFGDYKDANKAEGADE